MYSVMEQKINTAQNTVRSAGENKPYEFPLFQAANQYCFFLLYSKQLVNKGIILVCEMKWTTIYLIPLS